VLACATMMQDPVKQHHITAQSIHDLDHLIANHPQVYDYDETARLWTSARDWRDLCHLQTLYVQGVLPFHPTYSGALSCESSTIVGCLQSFNQHAFLTTVSQPACASTALNSHGDSATLSATRFCERMDATRPGAKGHEGFDELAAS